MNMPLFTGDQQWLKQLNRMAVLRLLARSPAQSRADLAHALQLTRSTVGQLVRELMDEGWLQESTSEADHGLGRRPTPLHLDAERLALIGVELGVDGLRLLATNVLGEPLDESLLETPPQAPPAVLLDTLAQAVLALARRLQLRRRRLLGVGVGLPGSVNEAQGLVLVAPNLGWRGVAAGAALRQAWQGTALASLPLFLQNEADMAVVGEQEFEGSAASPLLYLSLGPGVGAGVMVNDVLMTGRQGLAGEVGHTVLQPGGALCSCGRRGCAEAELGLRALLRQGASSASLQQAGTRLGVLLNNLWTAFDPERIVLGGPALQMGPELLEAARCQLERYARASLQRPPVLQQARHGESAVAIGAAAFVRYRLTRPLTNGAGGTGLPHPLSLTAS